MCHSNNTMRDCWKRSKTEQILMRASGSKRCSFGRARTRAPCARAPAGILARPAPAPKKFGDGVTKTAAPHWREKISPWWRNAMLGPRLPADAVKARGMSHDTRALGERTSARRPSRACTCPHAYAYARGGGPAIPWGAKNPGVFPGLKD